jgi:hypothetical protein
MLGATETGLLDQLLGVKTYLQSLAQPTPRKLALLVGINQYPQGQPLKGCITDLELQRDLLIYRFGFNPRDILILTDQEATRENIETAFVEHLIGQVKADDIVVFHFSGYGSQVKVPEFTQETLDNIPVRIVNSLVPVDGTIPTKGVPVVNDLLEETLLWLARSLPTNKQTLILDTSHFSEGDSFQGNLRVRSCPIIEAKGPSPEELAFQQKLLFDINNSKSFSRLKGSIPGVILKAVGNSQIATEGQWNGLNAGLFTYSLTQYLWQITAPTTIQMSLGRTSEAITYLRGSLQTSTAIAGNQKTFLSYYTIPDHALGAEAIITALEDNGKTAEIKLVGLPLSVLANYGLNSRFCQEDRQDLILEIRSRDGLNAKAKLIKYTEEIAPLKVGHFLQEIVRIIPKNLGLTVALGSSLERIERVDATSAFSDLSLVHSVINLGEDAADCIFGKVDRQSNNINTENLGYQLLLTGGCPIPNSQGKTNEAVKLAVNRLTPHFEKILAVKLWHMTLNEGSSKLKVKVTLAKGTKGNYQPFIERKTQRFPGAKIDHNLPISKTLGIPETSFLPTIKVGEQIEYVLENHGDQPLYWLLLGLNSSSNPITFYLPEITPIPAQEIFTIPSSVDSLNWTIAGEKGLGEMLVIFSTSPFTKTQKLIADHAYSKGERPQVLELDNILEITESLLQDLNQSNLNLPSDVYGFDVNHWATLSFIYEVI